MTTSLNFQALALPSGMVELAVVALLAVGLAAVHVFAGRLRSLNVLPRSRWLSLAGGASVAYVFVHVLPELESRRSALEDIVVGFFEHHVYLVALVGFTSFYGLEQVVQQSRTRNRQTRGVDETPSGAFWLHVSFFAAYNLLIGYLLVHREQPGLASLLFFAVAMGLHLLVNDWGLRHHHGDLYHRFGRWLLAGGVLAGFGIGVLVAVNVAAVSALFAFLAGGVVLNVIKEELPAERESRFLPFVVGAGLYAGLLLVI